MDSAAAPASDRIACRRWGDYPGRLDGRTLGTDRDFKQLGRRVLFHPTAELGYRTQRAQQRLACGIFDGLARPGLVQAARLASGPNITQIPSHLPRDSSEWGFIAAG